MNQIVWALKNTLHGYDWAWDVPLRSHAGYVPGVVEIRGYIAINQTTRYLMMSIYLLKEKEGTRLFVWPSLVEATQRQWIFFNHLPFSGNIREIWMRRDHHNVVWINEPVLMQEKSSCVTMLTTAIHHAKFLIKTMPLTGGVLHRESQTENLFWGCASGSRGSRCKITLLVSGVWYF